MNKKLKKQKRKLFTRIIVVMAASFLAVAVLLSYFTLEMTQRQLLSDVETKFDTLSAQLSDPSSSLYYDTLRSIVESAASEYVYVPMNSAKAVHYDIELADSLSGLTMQMLTLRRTGNIQIILRVLSGAGTDKSLIIDTDDHLAASFTALENKENKVDYNGELSYKSFRKSMSDEQYEKIAAYLQDSPDDEETAYLRLFDNTGTKIKEYFQLVCTEFYVGAGNKLIPKTLEIVLTDNTHDWYAQDSVVERFELSVNEEEIAGRELKSISPDTKPLIKKAFFFHTFSKDNLKKQYRLSMKNDYEPANLGWYHSIYSNHKMFFVDTAGYSKTGNMQNDETETKRRELYLEFYYNIDVIPNASAKIAYLTAIAFLFFLTIGVILCITLWQVMKTQIKEEEKRREITRGLAHDIKTPLFIIEGYAQNLMEDLNTEKRAHYCTRMMEHSEEIDRLIHRMLDFSKLDSEVFQRNDESFDFSALLEETLSRLDDISDWKKLSVESEKTLIIGDRELYRRVLVNLIDNALRYATPYSEIRIVLKDRRFSVSNACTGLALDDIKHLTEPYYRKDQSRNSTGNGLGLAITKSILDLYHNRLDISLKENRITFSFKLP